MFRPHPKKRPREEKIKNPNEKKAPRLDCSQLAMLKKINHFRRLERKHLIDERGACHGLSLYWLKKMAQGRQDEMYTIVKRIIDYDKNDLQGWNDDVEIHSFILKFFKRQNPMHFFGVSQRQIHAIMKLKCMYTLDQKYSDAELLEMLKTFHGHGQGMVITGGRTKEGNLHTIAIYYQSESFWLYDSNHPTGCAMRMASPEMLLSFIGFCLYHRFGEPSSAQHDLALTVLPLLSEDEPTYHASPVSGYHHFVADVFKTACSYLPI